MKVVIMSTLSLHTFVIYSAERQIMSEIHLAMPLNSLISEKVEMFFS